MKASDLVVECLQRENVEVVFGIPGVEILDLMQSLSQSNIRFVNARHEGGAAFMADVYARVTGKAGVCITSGGAAATNLVTSLACATMNHSPVVAITGQRNLARIQREPYQAINLCGALAPVTKWNRRIERPELIPERMHQAFKIAQTETLGACHIELPEDIARADCERGPFPPAQLRRPAPPDRFLDGAAELIDNSANVVILAGNGALRGNSSEELDEFVRDIGLTVISTPNAKGILPFDHPNFGYTVDIHCPPESLDPLKNADVVIAIGYDLREFPPDLWNPDGKVEIIHMSASAAEINRNYQVSVEIVGDIRDSLRNLKMMIRKPKKLNGALTHKRALKETLSQFSDDNSFPLKPQKVLLDLSQVIQPEDLLVCDMGTHRYWVSQLYPAPGAGSVILSQSHNATGFALPGAVGAQLANPERRVVALCGDGGFLAGAAELITARQCELPIVVLVLADNQLSYIRSLQVKKYQNPVATEIINPDFTALAKSFGVEAWRVSEGESVRDSVERALASRKTTVVEVPIDAVQNERIFDNWLETE
jgi:acetolactate synthase-1/2/3 large subunit